MSICKEGLKKLLELFIIWIPEGKPLSGKGKTPGSS